MAKQLSNGLSVRARIKEAALQNYVLDLLTSRLADPPAGALHQDKSTHDVEKVISYAASPNRINTIEPLLGVVQIEENGLSRK